MVFLPSNLTNKTFSTSIISTTCQLKLKVIDLLHLHNVITVRDLGTPADSAATVHENREPQI